MYAVVGKWQMDPAQRVEQDQALNDQIVPMVKQAPGFVSASWGRTADGVESVSFVVFEDEASAKAFAEVVASDPEHRELAGVEPGWLTTIEIGVTA